MATAAVTAATLPVILIVNTNPSMAQRVAMVVPPDDYQLEMADSGLDALQRLQHRPLPDLVLMNVGASSSDGMRTLQQLRQLHPDLKIIVTGASDDTRAAAQAVRMGAVDYLGESVHTDELKTVLHQYLNEHSPSVESQA